MLYLGLASPAIVKAAPADQKDRSQTENILLREYFLERYLALQGDLYNMVAIVAVDLQAKDVSPPLPSPAAEFFANEVRFLRKQVGKAEGRLKALFLQPTYTVDLEELRGDNVLTELKSIEQVSKDIKKKAYGPPHHMDMDKAE